MYETTAAWCGSFERREWYRPRPSKLTAAHHSVVLFSDVMIQKGGSLTRLQCDDRFGIEPVEPTSQIQYFCTHGVFDEDGYSYLTSRAQADPTRFQSPVVVADTCYLVGRDHKTSKLAWESKPLSLDVRLILGCRTQITIDPGAAKRGEDFAEIISGNSGAMSISAAWSFAMQTNRPTPEEDYDSPVAIGIGDTAVEARKALEATSIDQLMPRKDYFRYEVEIR